ncbi:MAG: hypothetical protein IKT63_02660 [Oscillospiraceae bacterium]|nr:hypothetical protein [Oscillospiraceae bacterium]
MKKFLSLLLCITVFLSLTITASADIGPKPSVRITFEGVENGTEYYGTLLSERKSTGPASAWDGVPGHEDHYNYSYELWKVFADYTDEDGYYFLQEVWDCTGTNQLNWTYYPPSPFKILLYFPETDTYLVSDIYERYAFDSYYTVNLSDLSSDSMTAEESYNFTWEIISLLARIAATILLEIAIAFIFGYREKKALRFIAVVNIITQIALNVALNIINYNMGSMAFTFFFVIMEIAVFALEAVIFALLLKRFTSKSDKARSTAYAFAANAASFAIGLWLSHIIPGIF